MDAQIIRAVDASRDGTQLPDGRSKCKAGYYSGGTDFRCVPCPKGHECPTLSEKPTACVAGKYAHKTGMAACQSCPD